MLAIDTSLSMEATDVAPNRLEAAQDAATSFLDQLPDKINVGLVAFNGIAPRRGRHPRPTARPSTAAIDNLTLGEGTAIGEAIFASLDAIKTGAARRRRQRSRPARIVLMSRRRRPPSAGRNDAGRARRRSSQSVPVSTIAFGTDDGTITHARGAVADPRARSTRRRCRTIADATGGQFYAAASEESSTEVYEDIGSSVGYETEQREIATWFVGGALLPCFAAAGFACSGSSACRSRHRFGRLIRSRGDLLADDHWHEPPGCMVTP